MNIIVILKMVPDLVEDLEIDSTGKSLNTEFLRTILNESDDHALEQALLLKEQKGGIIKVVALDMGDIDDALFTALAKGADSAVKITGDFTQRVSSHTAARIYQTILKEMSYDLILTGVQAIDDLDGQTGAILASYLDLPYVGVVSGVQVNETEAIVRKEYPGGLRAEIAVKFPVVLGIQSASQPPRYVPVARIRQTMKTTKIEEITAPDVQEFEYIQPEVGVTLADGGTQTGNLPQGIQVRRMFKPEVSGRAEIITGNTDEIVNRLLGILSEKGLVR